MTMIGHTDLRINCLCHDIIASFLASTQFMDEAEIRLSLSLYLKIPEVLWWSMVFIL